MDFPGYVLEMTNILNTEITDTEFWEIMQFRMIFNEMLESDEGFWPEPDDFDDNEIPQTPDVIRHDNGIQCKQKDSHGLAHGCAFVYRKGKQLEL